MELGSSFIKKKLSSVERKTSFDFISFQNKQQ